MQVKKNPHSISMFKSVKDANTFSAATALPDNCSFMLGTLAGKQFYLCIVDTVKNKIIGYV